MSFPSNPISINNVPKPQILSPSFPFRQNGNHPFSHLQAYREFSNPLERHCHATTLQPLSPRNTSASKENQIRRKKKKGTAYLKTSILKPFIKSTSSNYRPLSQKEFYLPKPQLPFPTLPTTTPSNSPQHTAHIPANRPPMRQGEE